MMKKSMITAVALAGAFAASSASAFDGHSHSYYSKFTTPTYGTTYTAPTINLGPIEFVQPNSTVQYVQPATTSTFSYQAPVKTYTAPSYTTPSYAAQPTWAQPTYTSPNYVYPSYTRPAYFAPFYDGTAKVERRIDRLRSRIHNARDRGDLRKGERRKLRRNMREIRETYRFYKANDGIIDRAEHHALNDLMSRQSKRIRRLANNHRVAGPLVSPYARY